MYPAPNQDRIKKTRKCRVFTDGITNVKVKVKVEIMETVNVGVKDKTLVKVNV